MDQEIKQIFEMLRKRLDSMEKSQEQMHESSIIIQKSYIGIQEVLDKMQQCQRQVEERQKHMEIRQDEMFFVVKAIEDNNIEYKEKREDITYRMEHIEGIINKIGDMIEEYKAMKMDR